MKQLSKGLVRGGVTMPPQYLTGIDVLIGMVSAPGALVYPKGLDDQALRASLQAVLAHYPVLGARLRRDAQGMLYLDSQDQGVSFEVWQHDVALPAYGPARPLDAELTRYSRVIPPWAVIDKPDQALLELRVHHFKCGGSMLAMAGVHALCDGAAMWMMMMDWVRLHHGHPVTPPALDRAPLLATSAAHVARPYTQGLLYQPSLPHALKLGARFMWQHYTMLRKHVLRVTPDQIANWQAEARGSLAPEACPTPYELSTAHGVQLVSRAMRTGGTRHIGLVNDLRYRKIEGLGRKYFGNALGQDMLSLDQAFLADAPVHEVALRCRVPLDHVDHDSLLGYLGMLEVRRRARNTYRLASVAAEHCLDAGIYINNCAHLPIYKADFGSGPPSWFENARTVYRKVMVVSAPPGVGGFDVHITARREEIAAFRAVSPSQAALSP